MSKQTDLLDFLSNPESANTTETDYYKMWDEAIWENYFNSQPNKPSFLRYEIAVEDLLQTALDVAKPIEGIYKKFVVAICENFWLSLNVRKIQETLCPIWLDYDLSSIGYNPKEFPNQTSVFAKLIQLLQEASNQGWGEMFSLVSGVELYENNPELIWWTDCTQLLIGQLHWFTANYHLAAERYKKIAERPIPLPTDTPFKASFSQYSKTEIEMLQKKAYRARWRCNFRAHLLSAVAVSYDSEEKRDYSKVADFVDFLAKSFQDGWGLAFSQQLDIEPFEISNYFTSKSYSNEWLANEKLGEILKRRVDNSSSDSEYINAVISLTLFRITRLPNMTSSIGSNRTKGERRIDISAFFDLTHEIRHAGLKIDGFQAQAFSAIFSFAGRLADETQMHSEIWHLECCGHRFVFSEFNPSSMSGNCEYFLDSVIPQD